MGSGVRHGRYDRPLSSRYSTGYNRGAPLPLSTFITSTFAEVRGREVAQRHELHFTAHLTPWPRPATAIANVRTADTSRCDGLRWQSGRR